MYTVCIGTYVYLAIKDSYRQEVCKYYFIQKGIYSKDRVNYNTMFMKLIYKILKVIFQILLITKKQY